MPLLPFINKPIEVDVSDRIYNGTIFKQKACFKSMLIEQDEMFKTCSVTVFVHVSVYSDDNGAYGDVIGGKGLSGYGVKLVADNKCAVNPQTGEVLYIMGDEREDTWLAIISAKPEPLMLQGNFFEAIMHMAPVEIAPMLRRFMLQADTAPFNKYTT